MTAVGGGGNKRLSTQGREVILTHKPLNPLGIHDCALPPQLCRDAPVAIEAVAQTQDLNLAEKIGVGSTGCVIFKATIVAGAGNAGQPAQSLNIGACKLCVHHGFDDRDDAVPVLPCAS